MGPNGDVVEGANEHAVWCPGLPLADFRGNRDGFVRSAQNESGNHRGVARMSIREVELIYNLVDEGGLR